MRSVTTRFACRLIGQRVKVSGGTPGTVLYVYDEAGHLIGDYTSTGALVQETVWFRDIPVATIRPGTPVVVYYVHSDHLNTPRRVTRPSDNKLMWTWYSDPFGTDLPNENPAGGGTFKYNLRFPGQLYDSHAGLNQNYFRDYDPAIGRYVESDPIGLSGGASAYPYAADAPTARTDPTGEVPSPYFRLPPASGPSRVDAAPDYSMCSYYDAVARTFGCKYHAFAGKACRGESTGVNIIVGICDISVQKQNRIRDCLVRSDQAARSNPSCRIGNCGGCTKKSCIDEYHNNCFESAGVSKRCYGGNSPWSWPIFGGFPSDGD